jgi:hypothetical protein
MTSSIRGLRIMQLAVKCPAELSDKELLAEVKRLADQERVATSDLIVTLAELDTRRLYLGEGCSSLFSYCTRVLHLSEHAAYGRIEAARAARRTCCVTRFRAAILRPFSIAHSPCC